MERGQKKEAATAMAKPATDQASTQGVFARVVSGVGYYTGMNKFFESQSLPTQAANAVKPKSELEKKLEKTANERLEEFHHLACEILNIKDHKVVAKFWDDQARSIDVTVPEGVSEMSTLIEKEKNLDAKSMIEKMRTKADEFYLKRPCWLPQLFAKPWVRTQATHDFYNIFHDLDMNQHASIASALRSLKNWKQRNIPDLVITKKDFFSSTLAKLDPTEHLIKAGRVYNNLSLLSTPLTLL